MRENKEYLLKNIKLVANLVGIINTENLLKDVENLDEGYVCINKFFYEIVKFKRELREFDLREFTVVHFEKIKDDWYEIKILNHFNLLC